MLMCAIETSGRTCSMALLQGQEVLAYDSLMTPARHSMVLMPLIESLFQQSGVCPGDIDVYAVGSGPGSFTGLRIGIGTVKGLAYPNGTSCAGVSTLESLVCSAGKRNSVVVPVLDARRGRVYAGAYRWDPHPVPITDDCVMTLEQLWDRYRSQQVFFVGDAADICYTVWEQNGLSESVGHMVCEPDALGCAMAARRMVAENILVPPELLVPRYLLETQAERERRENQHNENLNSQ